MNIKFAVFRMIDKDNFPKKSPKDLFMGTFESLIRGQAYSIRMNKRYPEQRFYVKILQGKEIAEFNKMERVRISVDN